MTPDEDAPVPDDAVYYETVVTLGSDGMHISEPRAVTAAAQRSQNEHRLAIERGDATPTSYIAQDFACSYSSLWLYARTDWTGDKVCFSGCGSVYLDYVIRVMGSGGLLWNGNWVLSSGSYWPGAEQGVLVGDHGGYNSSWIPFAAFGAKGRFNLGTLVINGIGIGSPVQGTPCP